MRPNAGGGLVFGGFELDAKPIFHEAAPKDFENGTFKPDFDQFCTCLEIPFKIIFFYKSFYFILFRITLIIKIPYLRVLFIEYLQQLRQMSKVYTMGLKVSHRIQE